MEELDPLDPPNDGSGHPNYRSSETSLFSTFEMIRESASSLSPSSSPGRDRQ